MFTFLTLLL